MKQSHRLWVKGQGAIGFLYLNSCPVLCCERLSVIQASFCATFSLYFIILMVCFVEANKTNPACRIYSLFYSCSVTAAVQAKSYPEFL